MDLETIIGDLGSLSPSGFNPVSGMLSGATIARSALPIVFGVAAGLAHHLPDIEAKFADLEARLEAAWSAARHLDANSAAADLGAAWADAMAIYDDVGLPRATVQTVIAAAAKNNLSPGFTPSAIAAATAVARSLGLPV